MRQLPLLLLIAFLGCGGALPASDGCAGNSDCAGDQYCALTACGQPGTCAARPQICNEIFQPVCGCDGQTYSNACTAAGRGAPVAAAGACSGDSNP